MRVFVYEYFSGGALAGQPAALRREGWAMLSAVLDDLCRCRGVDVMVRLDPALSEARPWPTNIHPRFGGPEGEEKDLRDMSRVADFTLLIAPEYQDLLGMRCQWVEEVGGHLLGPTAAAVRLTADKLRLADYLTSRCLPTPSTVTLGPRAAELGFPLVVKPRFGAGSQATFLINNEDELKRCPQTAAQEGWHDELIAQPFIAGVPAGVSLVTGPGGKFCLKPVWQHLSQDGRLHYLGGGLPLAKELATAAKALSARILTAVEGLRGWCGADVVLHPKGSYLIEINPRLTTSYVGLRRLAKCNLMELLLSVAGKQTPPPVEWSDTSVYFHADGAIEEGKAELLRYANPFAK